MDSEKIALILSITVSVLSILVTVFLSYLLTHSHSKRSHQVLCMITPSAISFPDKKEGGYVYENDMLYFVLNPETKRKVGIGRTVDADICISSLDASRNHAKMFWKGKRWFIVDLGSMNGTLVNGDYIQSLRPLRNGDRIRLGDVEMIYQEKGTEKGVLIHMGNTCRDGKHLDENRGINIGYRRVDSTERTHISDNHHDD